MKVFSWIKDKIVKFNGWCATWMPGLKTYIATGLGAVSAGAAVLQQYISGLPLEQFISGTKIALISAVLFTLSFWFRSLATPES